MQEGFFAEKTEKAPLPAEYVANQKAVDAALLIHEGRLLYRERGLHLGMKLPASLRR